ncbi:hypothetical protein FQR65_LT14434 [Abscondita terminalis]|nr:hypothetical protein FQR65_LT14434 [Abscondita terminalis]
MLLYRAIKRKGKENIHPDVPEIPTVVEPQYTNTMLLEPQAGCSTMLDLHMDTTIDRERGNPMEEFDEANFKRRFRLTKNSVRVLSELLDPFIKPWTLRNHSISTSLQILCCLRFLATGSFQIMVADDLRIDRSTVCRIVKRVLPQIANLRQRYINMPEGNNKILELKNRFTEIARFPHIIGCIDGTHVAIQSPGGERAELYRNRKGFFSYNVQIVCDGNLKILDIDARWPGSTQDSTIFNNSLLKIRLEGNEFQNSFLLRDSAYPASNYMLTPFVNPITEAQARYNRAHIATRNTVERAIGVLKRRFALLSHKLRVAKQTALVAIVACAVLHNLAITENDIMNVEEIEADNNDDVPFQNNNQQGVAVRNAFAMQYFN